MHTIPGRRIILVLFLIFLLLPIYWLGNMSFKTNRKSSTMTLWPNNDAAITSASLRTELVFRLHQFAEIRHHQYSDLDPSRCRPPTPSRYRFS